MTTILKKPRAGPLGRAILFCMGLALLVGCAMLPQPTPSRYVGDPGPLGGCAGFFADLDRRVQIGQVMDPGAFRVPSYPYLRVNRFLASFGREIQDRDAFEAWVDRMQELDQAGRRWEIANLLDGQAADDETVAAIHQKAVACGNILRSADFSDQRRRQRLQEWIAAPDDYLTLRRALGFYGVTRWIVSRGVADWHAAARRQFSLEAPQGWRSIRYLPPEKAGVPEPAKIVSRARRDALSIPHYAPVERETLLQFHAPVWEVETTGSYDRLGSPYWSEQGVLAVDTQQPVVYTLISYTRFGSEILTQLNYIIWFGARPKESSLDIYGGRLDGVDFRVTLDATGAVLLYETIHNCGCYYKAYPTGRLTVRKTIRYAEPPLIFKAPQSDPSRQFIHVAMESRTHYVQHLYTTGRQRPPATATYNLHDYEELRGLAHPPKGSRSMFAEDGIVNGSQRLERLILWPMGVLSPGAMRQYGRHAVAFVGRRHFDDPEYLQEMFRRSETTQNREVQPRGGNGTGSDPYH